MKNSRTFTDIMNGLLVGLMLFVAIGSIFGFVAGILCLVGIAIMFFAPRQEGIAGLTNYLATALAKAQPKLIEKFASTELREIDPVTYKAFRRSSEIMFPSHKVLRTREDRPIEAGYLERTIRALGTGRNYNATGANGVSNVLVPSFITYNDPFSISMKQADDNTFTADEMMAGLVENTLKNFSRGNETTCVNFLYNNRSAVNVGVSEGTFNTPNQVFEVNEGVVGNRFAQIIETNMAENLYGGMPLTIFCDSIAFNKFRFLSAQGTMNAVNTSFQFDNKTFVLSLGLTAKAIALGYTKGFCEVAADGTFGILDWIPKQNRMGEEHLPYKWSMFSNPIDDCDYAVYQWYIAADQSGTGGYTQDLQNNFEFSIDLAPEIAPTDIGGAGETVIQAFGLV